MLGALLLAELSASADVKSSCFLQTCFLQRCVVLSAKVPIIKSHGDVLPLTPPIPPFTDGQYAPTSTTDSCRQAQAGRVRGGEASGQVRSIQDRTYSS